MQYTNRHNSRFIISHHEVAGASSSSHTARAASRRFATTTLSSQSEPADAPAYSRPAEAFHSVGSFTVHRPLAWAMGTPLEQTPLRQLAPRPPACALPAHASDGYKWKLGPTQTERGYKFATSEVVSVDGVWLIMSQTLNRGSFGKFRLAVDANDKLWAIKEFRSELFQHTRQLNASGVAFVKRRKTKLSTLLGIRHEIKMAWAAGSKLRVERLINLRGKFLAMMPYMDGGDLLQFTEAQMGALQTEHSFDRLAIALGMLREVGHQLKVMHARGYVHGDLKPANILYDSTGRFEIADFGGMAKLEAGKTHTHIVTPGYLAPERLFQPGSLHTAAPDIFSLGVMVLDLYALKNNQINWRSRLKTKDSFSKFDQTRTSFLTGLDAGQNWGRSRNRRAVYDEDLWLLKMFSDMHQDSPSLARLVLCDMLSFEPELRASAQDVTRFASQQMSPQQDYSLRAMMTEASGPGADWRGELIGVLRQQAAERSVSVAGQTEPQRYL